MRSSMRYHGRELATLSHCRPSVRPWGARLDLSLLRFGLWLSSFLRSRVVVARQTKPQRHDEEAFPRSQDHRPGCGCLQQLPGRHDRCLVRRDLDALQRSLRRLLATTMVTGSARHRDFPQRVLLELRCRNSGDVADHAGGVGPIPRRRRRPSLKGKHSDTAVDRASPPSRRILYDWCRHMVHRAIESIVRLRIAGFGQGATSGRIIGVPRGP
jgi:hypothetical protein